MSHFTGASENDRTPEPILCRGDEGMTLVELLVAMAIMLVIMAAFFALYFGLSGSASNTVAYSHQQSNVRNVMRVLEADLRSADPLTLVPATFTSDPNGSSAVGTSGTTSTDIVAMYEAKDRYSPCSGGSTTTNSNYQSPSPFVASAFMANVIWAYDPVAGTLTRYSDCSGSWTAGMELGDVTTAAKTMFTASSVYSSQTQITSVPTISGTTMVGQVAPLCGTSVRAVIKVSNKGQQIPFRVRVVVPLPNQTAVQSEACVQG